MPPISIFDKTIGNIYVGNNKIVKGYVSTNLIYEMNGGGSDMPPATGIIYACASDDSDGFHVYDKTLTLQGAKMTAGSNYRPMVTGIYPNGDFVVLWTSIVNLTWIMRKYSPDRTILWTLVNSDGWMFNQAKNARALIDSNGDIIVHSSNTSSADYRKTLKIDGTNGTIIWNKETHPYLYGTSLLLDKEDNFYTNRGSLLGKWDNNGNLIWEVSVSNSSGYAGFFVDKDYNVYVCPYGNVYYKWDKNGANMTTHYIENSLNDIYEFFIDEVNNYIYTATGYKAQKRDMSGNIIWNVDLHSTVNADKMSIAFTEDYKLIIGQYNGLNIFDTNGNRTSIFIDEVSSIAYYNPNTQPWADNS